MKFAILSVMFQTAIFIFGGCSAFDEPRERLTPEPRPYTSQLPDNYRKITVAQDSSADVLGVIQRPETEYLAQSQSTVASWSIRKKGYQRWFSLVAFDEESLLVNRKYFFHTDEKSHHLMAEDQKLFFDAQVTLPPEITGETYVNSDSQRIACLQYIREKFQSDIQTLTDESEVLQSGMLMMNQTFTYLMYKLGQSPALTGKLSREEGIEFNHINYGPGRIRMLSGEDFAHVQIKVGYRPWGFQMGLDFSQMREIER